jgi:lipoprotein-anchoring transpeptidase ErfK/SrfK
VLFACLAVLVGACSGGDRPSLADEKTPAPSGTGLGPTDTTMPGVANSIAQAVVPVVKVYDSPDAPVPSREFENPWFVNNDRRFPVNTVFLAERQRGDWVRVLLPVRPNGSTGWVRISDVRLVPNRFRIEVDLSEHLLRVYDGDRVFMEDTVAVGKPETPTPVGKFFIRVLLRAPDPTTVYGPYAYGLSSHSEVLEEFNGGDAEIGIHGNNDASVLGKYVSAGCIRMDNEKITRLASILPLGTLVEVRP